MSQYLLKHSHAVIKLLCAVAIIFYLVKQDIFNIKILLTTQFSLSSIIFLLVLLVLFSFFQALRWFCLIKAQHIVISFPRCISLYLISQFFTTFLPGLAGGDIVRSIYLTGEETASKSKAISTIIIDRVLGVYTLILLGALSFLIYTFSPVVLPEQANIIGKIILSVSISSTLFFILTVYHSRVLKSLLSWLGNTIQRHLELLRLTYARHPGLLFISVVSSLLSSIMFITAFWIVGSQLSKNLTLLQSAFTVPLIVTSNLMPLTPGGLGVGETTSYYLLQLFQIHTGAEIMFTLRLWTLLIRLPGGILFITTKRKK